MMNQQPVRICIAKFGRPQGVRGWLRLHVFTEDPDAVFKYKPVTDGTGTRQFALKRTSYLADGTAIVEVDGVKTRDAAESLVNTELYIERSILPELDGDEGFYHADLVGLRVEDLNGRTLGAITAVLNYGAGDLLEVRLASKRASVLVPFTEDAVPVVDVKQGFVRLDPDLAFVGEDED
ncbi:MAG: ribosome maturation factor RimM [Holosporales bacterium]